MFMTRLIFPGLWRRCAKGAVGASCIWNKAGFCLLLCLLLVQLCRKVQAGASTLSAKCSYSRKDKELLRCCFPFSLSLVNSPRWCTTTQVPWPLFNSQFSIAGSASKHEISQMLTSKCVFRYYANKSHISTLLQEKSLQAPSYASPKAQAETMPHSLTHPQG